MSSRKLNVFVSYTQVDREWAEWIAWQIEAAGHEATIQAWDFPAGSNFVTEMDRATKECDRTVAVLSPEYLAKVYTQAEWKAAFAKDPTGEKRVLLPIRIRECEIEGLLGQVVYLDLLGLAEEEARERLWRNLGGERAKPSRPPAYPVDFPGEPDEPEDEAPEVAGYRKWAEGRHSRVDLVGVGAGDVRLRLEEIYVPLRMACRAEAESHGPSLDLRALRAEHGEENLELDGLFPTLAELGRRHAAILGHPGAGKTTALRKLAQDCLAKPGALGLEPGTLPIFLPLRWLRSKDLRRGLSELIGEYLAEVSSGELDEALGEQLWRRGRLLLLLDGLDEVAEDERRAELASWLDWQLGRSGPRASRAVVTSRFAGYGPGTRLQEDFAVFEIRPLEAHQVDRLVRLWFREAQRSLPGFPEDQARQRADELVAALAGEEYSSQRLKVLVSSPLLLTLLCVIVWRGGEMPRERVAFYEQCLRVLLASWGKVTKGSEPLLGVQQALALLRPLAWQLHLDERRDDLSRIELANHFRKHLRGPKPAASPFEIFDWLYREAGVLAEYAPQHYGFIHLGLQEYLAASHVASRGEEHVATLAEHFGERWWREVISLMAALPGHRVLRLLLERVLAGPALLEHGDLLRECLREAAELEVEPILEVLREAGAVERQAAALRLLRGHCRDEVLAAAEELLASPSSEVAALARRLVEGCRPSSDEGELELDLFLVHEPAAEAEAEALASALRGRGMRLPPKTDWHSQLEKLVATTRGVAVLVGASGRGPWEQRDVAALLEFLDAEGRSLVPVLLPGGPEPPALPEGLGWSSWVDLRQGLGHCEAFERAIVERESAASAVAVLTADDLEPGAGKRWHEPVTGMAFVRIPSGRFEMGGSGEYDGKPAHGVRLSSFWLAETPVTNRQYGLFLEQNKSDEPGYWRDERFSDPEQPVVGVSWHDAVRFCEWLSEQGGGGFRLPSEAQWEYAARGTDGRIYPWGDEEPDDKRACFATGKPAAVGSFPGGRGPFGTLDQAGNVWEWCLDVWDEKAYEKRAGSEPVDLLVTKGDEQRRVLRGGAWSDAAVALRAAVRLWLPASYRDVDVGFRVLAAPASLGS
jgi:formylglycine-generating enzyme required for sulfatase activity